MRCEPNSHSVAYFLHDEECESDDNNTENQAPQKRQCLHQLNLNTHGNFDNCVPVQAQQITGGCAVAFSIVESKFFFGDD